MRSSSPDTSRMVLSSPSPNGTAGRKPSLCRGRPRCPREECLTSPRRSAPRTGARLVPTEPAIPAARAFTVVPEPPAMFRASPRRDRPAAARTFASATSSDVDEIAGLLRRRRRSTGGSSRSIAADEAGNDRGVGGRRVLPGPEDVEVPQGRGPQPVEGAEDPAVVSLRRACRRRTGKAAPPPLPRLGKARRVAVDRRRRGQDEAPRPGVPRGDEHVEGPGDIDGVGRGSGLPPDAGRRRRRPGEGRNRRPRPPSGRSRGRGRRLRRARSAFRNGARFARVPVRKLSRTRTRAPRRTRISTMCDPMKPAPPVTR